jgi:hypothetical protein
MSAGSKMEKARLAYTSSTVLSEPLFSPTDIYPFFPKERSVEYELSHLSTRNKKLAWLGTKDFSFLFNINTCDLTHGIQRRGFVCVRACRTVWISANFDDSWSAILCHCFDLSWLVPTIQDTTTWLRPPLSAVKTRSFFQCFSGWNHIRLFSGSSAAPDYL